MNPVEKALWFLESHRGDEIALEDIADVAGVSRFHMTRAFGVATGQSVMRYLRGRRLSEAARALAGGAPDILSVALEAGYGSHEAFTRAFRDQFGTTPEAVRTGRTLDNLELVGQIKMNETMLAELAAPRFETAGALLIAGLGERYYCQSSEAIPNQWERFGAWFGNVPRQVGKVAYGVCHNADDTGNFDYIAGVEVSDFSDLPKELSRVRVPPQRYAVFSEPGHISKIRSVFNTIWNRWLPESGHKAADAPFFERYPETFDARTGAGGYEIWIPLEK